MLCMTLVVLLVVTTQSHVVAMSSSFAVAPEYDNHILKSAAVIDKQPQQDKSAIPYSETDASADKVHDWRTAEIDGIALKFLTEDELKELLDNEDNIIASELDVLVAKKLVDRRKMDAVTETNLTHSKHRQKRFFGLIRNVAKAAGKAIKRLVNKRPGVIYVDNSRHRKKRSPLLLVPRPGFLFGRRPFPIADKKEPGRNTGKSTKRRQKRWLGIAAKLLSAGRNLFRGAVRAPKPTVSGNRVTQQYTRPGNYGDAVRDFNRFQPDNVKSFNKNGISGQTGTVGQHRFTVRDGSKQGSPTLEIRSPRPTGERIRKFRYNQK
ncbi:hypothetical protein BsWGS_10262 [Bradybaena similaris]